MPNQIVPTGYEQLLRDLKSRIRSAQLKAALAVNQELVLLYWQIGREILQRQGQEGWGTKVIDRLAKDLKQEFPEMKEGLFASQSTALFAQSQTNTLFESVAAQRFQKVYCGSFDRQLL